jgi:hypothetical protein
VRFALLETAPALRPARIPPLELVFHNGERLWIGKQAEAATRESGGGTGVRAECFAAAPTTVARNRCLAARPSALQ